VLLQLLHYAEGRDNFQKTAMLAVGVCLSALEVGGSEEVTAGKVLLTVIISGGQRHAAQRGRR
jgi:hypothetical protein